MTESAVLELLERGVPELNITGIRQSDIISLSGVMSKAPNGVPSAHFLFGPGAKGNLKMALATETFDSKNVLVSSLIEKVHARGMQIIETTKVEHDAKMAIIQGLMHLWLVIVGDIEDEIIQKNLIIPWRTPIQTIVDMIHANPFAEIRIREFFEALSKNNPNISRALRGLIKENLSKKDMEKFGTPNSERITEHLRKKKNDIKVPKKIIDVIINDLNTFGHKSLCKRIDNIRGNIPNNLQK